MADQAAGFLTATASLGCEGSEQHHVSEVGGPEFRDALRAVDDRVAHLDVSAVAAPYPLRYDAVLADPAVATDWLRGHAALTEATYGTCPPGLSSASVLQYLVDCLAVVTTHAAVLGPFVLDLDPACWSLAVDPHWLYPVAIGVQPGRARREPDRDARVAATHAAYLTTARAVATSFPALGRMSSHQRLGMVDDMWDTGWQRAHTALLDPPQPPPVRRRSCCLVYALPGCHECAGCPRMRG